MKKNLLIAIALLLAAASIGAAAVLWAQNVRYQSDIADLTALADDLQNQSSGRSPSLSIGETTLTAHLRNDSLAEVTFTLIPFDPSGADASLKILADDAVIAEAPCQWDGTTYTALAELIPVNGCTYLLALGGNEYVLASPANGAYPDLIHLADSLSAYCNLVLGDWIVESGRLTMDTCYLQVQAPRLGAVELPDSQETSILLKHRGDLIDGAAVVLEQGEGAGSYEGILTGLSLTLPVLEVGEEVDLWMEATLADGQMVSVCAATWTRDPGGWAMSAG